MSTNTNREENQLPNSESTQQESEIFEYGDLIVQHLANLGIDYVFGVPGGGIEPFYNALARSERKGLTRSVVARHETGAAFMANAYARSSGKIGVCTATAGPGATNLITGVSCAYTDGVPMLVITGQSAINNFNMGSAQDSSDTGVNTVDMFDSCTHYSTLVSHPDQLESKLLTAISMATGNTPGPVHISIPLDILRQAAEAYKGRSQHLPLLEQEVWPNPDNVNVLKMTLNNIDKATLLVGQDCEAAVSEIIAFAEQKNWSIVTTPMGKGLISSYHPLNKGVFGLAGHDSAFEALSEENAQMVIAIGTSLDECATAGWNELVFSKRLIHIDSNPNHLNRSTIACMRILGSPKRVFAELIDENFVSPFEYITPNNSTVPTYMNQEAHDKYAVEEGLVKPQRLFSEISQKAPANTQVTLDIGNSFLWGIHHWHNKQEENQYKNQFHISIGFGSMGWALGSAIGLAMGSPKDPVIAFTGDGSWLMNGQEVTTAMQEDLNIMFVILNDGALGTVKHGQRLAGAEQTSYKLPEYNFAEIAKAMGIRSLRVESTEALKNIDLEAIFAESGPFVVEVLIDPEETPPLGQRMKMLGTAENDEEIIKVAEAEQQPIAEEAATNQLNTNIWEEVSEANNPFAAHECFCHGYDVYGDLIKNIDYLDYCYLLFKGELPNPQQKQLLNKLSVALANPGPRDPSIMAAMNAGVGGSTWSATLTAAITAGSGQLGGSRELHHVMELFNTCGQSLEAWQTHLKIDSFDQDQDIWQGMEHIPGFDPNGVSCPQTVIQLLNILSEIAPNGAPAWLKHHRIQLEEHTRLPLSMVAVVASALYELGFDTDQAELLYLMFRLPGAAAHGHEQARMGFQQFPFFMDGLDLTNDPAANDESVDQKEKS